ALPCYGVLFFASLFLHLTVRHVLPSILRSTPIPFFFFNHPPPPAIYTLSLHDALPIFRFHLGRTVTQLDGERLTLSDRSTSGARSEEHTSELQSHLNLVCRLLLEKKKRKTNQLIA